MPFNDRSDAGRELAKALATYKKQQPVILALPRGGVPVAAEVCAALNAPLDLVLVRKVGVPFQPELAMGAVVDGATPIIARNEDVIQAANINEATFNAVCDAELCEIEQRRQRYLGTRDRVEVAGHTAIVIDDGIATGATMKAALHAIRARRPQKLVLAVPVAPTSTLAELQHEADDIVCLEDYEVFGAIGVYYANFRQVSDQEVIDILKRFAMGGRKPAKQLAAQTKPAHLIQVKALLACWINLCVLLALEVVMSAVGLESIEHTVQLTHTWINGLDARLGWDDKHRSYRLLRTVLQAIRDWLKVEEAAKFGAQLPELLRGVYYEHWQPAKAPVKRRSKVDFVARVDQAFEADPLVFTSEAISTVFQFLSDKITPGEIEHVHHALPADIRALWPIPSRAA